MISQMSLTGWCASDIGSDSTFTGEVAASKQSQPFGTISHQMGVVGLSYCSWVQMWVWKALAKELRKFVAIVTVFCCHIFPLYFHSDLNFSSLIWTCWKLKLLRKSSARRVGTRSQAFELRIFEKGMTPLQAVASSRSFTYLGNIRTNHELCKTLPLRYWRAKAKVSGAQLRWPHGRSPMKSAQKSMNCRVESRSFGLSKTEYTEPRWT